MEFIQIDELMWSGMNEQKNEKYKKKCEKK